MAIHRNLTKGIKGTPLIANAPVMSAAMTEAFLEGKGFEDTIRRAGSLDGDTDAQAATGVGDYLILV